MNFLGGKTIFQGLKSTFFRKGAFHVFCLWVGSFPRISLSHLEVPPPPLENDRFRPPKNPKVQNIPDIPGNRHAKQFLGNEMMMFIRKKPWISPELRKFPQVCGETFWFRT